MLRTFFFFLILANLLFFAWTQGYFGSVVDGREPQRLVNQLAPDKLQVLASGDRVQEPTGNQLNCRLLTGIAPSAAQQLVSQSAERFPDLHLTIKLNESPTTAYWVLIPPHENKLAAERKAAELRKRDIADFSVLLEEGPDRFAILMGVFNAEAAANQYVVELAKRNVKSAKVLARENPLDRVQLEVRGPADRLASQLAELLGPQSTTKIVDCAAAR